jgi:hypothetical protein
VREGADFKDASLVLSEAIEALQVVALVNRFILPYALVGRHPHNSDIEAEARRLSEEGHSELNTRAFATLCQQIRVEAAALLHNPGKA